MQGHGRFLWLIALVTLLSLLVGGSAVQAAEKFEFVAGKQGDGSLELAGKVPIVVVRGTPEEIGEQLGTLLRGPLADMAANQDRLLAGFRVGAAREILMQTGKLMASHFPPEYVTELQATSKA